MSERSAFRALMTDLQAAGPKAVAELRELLKDDDAKVRLSAATALVKFAVAAGEQVEVLDRLSALEDRLNGGQTAAGE